MNFSSLMTIQPSLIQPSIAFGLTTIPVLPDASASDDFNSASTFTVAALSVLTGCHAPHFRKTNTQFCASFGGLLPSGSRPRALEIRGHRGVIHAQTSSRATETCIQQEFGYAALAGLGLVVSGILFKRRGGWGWGRYQTQHLTQEAKRVLMDSVGEWIRDKFR